MAERGEKAALTHLSLASRFRWSLAGTYGLLTLENLFLVATPYLIGQVIDGLINGSLDPLWLFSGLAVAAVIVSVFRRMFDTRVYRRIFSQVAAETAERDIADRRSISAISARISFVREFTDFFEIMLPTAMMSLVMLVGSVVMLLFLSLPLFGVTVAVALAIGLVFYGHRRRIEAGNAVMNDETERQVDVLASRDTQAFGLHVQQLVERRVDLSDIEARNFGVVFMLTLLLTGFAAFIMVRIEDASTGDIFAAITYIIQFSQSVTVLPFAFQQYVRTSEISGRLSKEHLHTEEASEQPSGGDH